MSDDRDDRPKLSWRERDARKNRSSHASSHEPPRDRPRSRAATQQYLRKVDLLFSKTPGGPEVERLTHTLRDALGTPGLAEACRAYRDALGMPEDPALLAHYLDAGDRELVLAGLAGLVSAREAGRLDRPASGLRSQLRMLASGSDDEIAEAAEELLGAL